jgi:hypothetical protein
MGNKALPVPNTWSTGNTYKFKHLHYGEFYGEIMSNNAKTSNTLDILIKNSMGNKYLQQGERRIINVGFLKRK